MCLVKVDDTNIKKLFRWSSGSLPRITTNYHELAIKAPHSGKGLTDRTDDTDLIDVLLIKR